MATNKPMGKHAAPQKDNRQSSTNDFGDQKTNLMSPLGAADSSAPDFTDFPAFDAAPGNFQPDFFPEYKGKSSGSGKNKKVAIIAAIAIVLALVVAYCGGAYYFSNHFYPNTTMGTIDVSMDSVSQAADELNKEGSNYSFRVAGQGVDFQVTASEAGITVDGESAAQKAVADNNIWAWPAEVFATHDVSLALAAQYNASGLQDLIQSRIDEFNATATDPVDATIQYDEPSKSFVVKPEEAGTKLDIAPIMEAVDAAAVKMEDEVQVTQDDLIKPAVTKDDARLKTAVDQANSYTKANVSLKLGDEQIDAGSIDGVQISQWVRLGDDYTVTFDDVAMNEWVTEKANSMDTVGTERKYTTPYGKEVTVSGGTYGWEIDTEALVGQVVEAIKTGATTSITVPCVVEAATYKTPGTPEWGAYADVDLSEQHARFYGADGKLLWESDVITGIPDGKHDTPTGVWTCFIRESPSTLKGDIQQSTGEPEYETVVQFWMQFTYSGCGFHDATWQPGFGGDMYKTGYGSHGCVNLPYSAAEQLYGIISVGNAVVVHW